MLTPKPENSHHLILTFRDVVHFIFLLKYKAIRLCQTRMYFIIAVSFILTVYNSLHENTGLCMILLLKWHCGEGI